MAKNNDNLPPIEITSRYSLPQRRDESLIYLNETEQERLRGLISGIDDSSNWWEIALGIFASAALSFWASYFFFLPENTPETAYRWVFAIALTMTGLTFISILGMLGQKKMTTNSKQAALDEFDRIKGQFQNLGDEDPSSSTATPHLIILSAKYGTTEKSIDVSRRLIDLISNDSLDVPASNETAGDDPVMGAVKDFEIEYRVGENGDTITRKFREGEQIKIP